MRLQRSDLFYYKIWYFVFFIAMGLIVPQFGPFVFNENRLPYPGLIFLSAQIAHPVGTFLSGYISDKTLHVRVLNIFLTVTAFFSILCLAYTPDMAFTEKIHATIWVSAGWSGFMFSLGGILSLVNVSYLQNGYSPNHFGWIRLFGTLGFTSINGVLMFFPLTAIEAIGFAPWFLLGSIIFLFFQPAKREIEYHPEQAVTFRKIWNLLKAPLFFVFMVIMGGYFFAFSATEYVVSSYIRDFSFIVDPVAFVWFAGTVVEILFFLISPWLIEKSGSLGLVFWGILAGGVRFSLLFFIEGGEILLWMQGLHGIQFSGGYLGALLYLKEKTHPQRLATAQAIFTMFSRAVGTALGGYFLGNITGKGGYDLVFAISSIVSLSSLVLLLVFIPWQRGKSHFVQE